MEERLVVSVHIPKTAGTTLAAVFSRCYNRRIMFDYDGYSNPAEASTIIKNHRDFISNYFSVLHGHFYARKYFDVFPDAHFVSVVRHPVERVISQYFHEMNEASSDAWYHQDIRSGRMDLPTFASQPGIGDAMSVHLAGRPMSEYSLILVTERLRLSLELFGRSVRPLRMGMFFGDPPKLPFENVMQSREISYEVSDSVRQATFDRTQADNALYAEAVSLLETRANTLLKK